MFVDFVLLPVLGSFGVGTYYVPMMICWFDITIVLAGRFGGCWGLAVVDRYFRFPLL